MKKLIALILTGLLGLAASGSAFAFFHTWRINEIYSNADGSVQFLELVCSATFGCNDGETFSSGVTITVTPSGGSAGTPFTFPGNISAPLVNKTLLIATPGFAAVAGVTPDYSIPVGFIAVNGGTIRINNGSIDTVAYTALPAGNQSKDRNGNVNTATPMNFAGVTGTIPAPPSLTVNKTGTGTVTSFPAGISCGATCTANFTQDNLVKLTATPGGGFVFTSWTGCNAVSGNQCTVKINGATSVTATFTASGSSANAIVQVSAGGFHTVAIRGDGSLWAWGGNAQGQFGNGTTTDSVTPVQVGTGYVAVSAGFRHTLALKADGSLWAWGFNALGQLGDGTTTDNPTPAQIGTGFAAIAAGYFNSYAIKTDGSLWAWGLNDAGEVGDGTTTNRSSPVQIGTGYIAVAAGQFHAIALQSDGTVLAWGANGNGQVGDNSTTNRPSPVAVGSGYASVGAGSSYSLAIQADGTLRAWGANDVGQLGIGSTGASQLLPMTVGTGYASITAGGSHTLVLKTDGSLWAAGLNGEGRLGDGTTTNRPSPVQIGTGYIAVEAGDDHSLGIKSDGSLWAWGSNFGGRLGDGTTTDRLSPVPVVFAVPDTQAPTVPAGLTANAVSVSQINLSWTTATDNVDVTAYRVLRGGVFLTTVNAPTVNFSDTGLAASTNFSYTVGACDAAANCSAQSTAASATTQAGPDTQPPTVPAGLTATPVSGSQINLAWTASTDNVGVTQYRIYRDGNATPLTTLTGTPPVTSFSNTGLTASTAYSYTVAACDALVNCSAQSSPVSATTLAAGTVSFTPALALSWNLMGNALNLVLNVATTFGGNANINSVWKWDAAQQNWYYYSPALTPTQLQTFADNRGYQVLSTIGPGEGYWVNTANATALPAQVGTLFNYNTVNFTALPTSWNLISTGANQSPHVFSNGVSTLPPPVSGVNASFLSLWAWDAAQQTWYYYAPVLENTLCGSNPCGLGGVKNYTDARGYLHFEDFSKKLNVGTGFWVNR